MQTIIVATDFSPIADNAVAYALAHAAEIKARVVLFHLFKLSSHAANSLVGTHGIDEMLNRRKRMCTEIAKKLSSENGVEVISHVSMGEFLNELETAIDAYDAKVLVIGMPEKTFEQDLLGNTTTAAIYSFKFPILAVPQSARYHGIKTILYACDMKRGIHRLVLERIKELAALLHAHIEVFFVGDELRKLEYETQLKEGLEGVLYEYKTGKLTDSVISTIQEEAAQIGADLLIMTPHRYGFWSSIVHRSKTRAMASNGKVPLLSLPY